MSIRELLLVGAGIFGRRYLREHLGIGIGVGCTLLSSVMVNVPAHLLYFYGFGSYDSRSGSLIVDVLLTQGMWFSGLASILFVPWFMTIAVFTVTRRLGLGEQDMVRVILTLWIATVLLAFVPLAMWVGSVMCGEPIWVDGDCVGPPRRGAREGAAMWRIEAVAWTRPPLILDTRAGASYRAAPPSTVIIEPVIISASSETANSTAFAMSSGSWSRPSGVDRRRRS